MVIDGGMPMGMSGGCSTCQQHVMSDSSMMHGGMPHGSMMPGQTFESHHEQQPTLATPPRSSMPGGSPAPPAGSTVPGEMAPVPMQQPMGQPMSEPMTSMRPINYGAALFGAAPAEPQSYPGPSGQPPVYHEQSIPMYEAAQPPSAPPAPPLASPAAHLVPALLPAPAMPTFPGEHPGAPQPSDFYSPKHDAVMSAPHPIQLQSASIPAAQPGKKPMRPFSESAKPRTTPPAQPQWEGTLQVQAVHPAGGSLPPLP